MPKKTSKCWTHHLLQYFSQLKLTLVRDTWVSLISTFLRLWFQSLVFCVPNVNLFIGKKTYLFAFYILQSNSKCSQFKKFILYAIQTELIFRRALQMLQKVPFDVIIRRYRYEKARFWRFEKNDEIWMANEWFSHPFSCRWLFWFLNDPIKSHVPKFQIRLLIWPRG